MIKIMIPDNNIPERTFVLEYIFAERLDIKINITSSDINYTQILLPNKKKIQINDAFFNNHKDELSYLSLDYLPNSIKYVKLENFSSSDIPIIFGENTLRIRVGGVKINFDFLADIFFYLSRWEENLTFARDDLDRPIEQKLFIVKKNLYKRPVVDEFVVFLAELIQKTGYTRYSLKKDFNIIPTHDVDYVKKWKNTFHAWKEIGGDTIKRKNLKRSIYNFLLWMSSKLKFIDEPNDTISKFMNFADQYQRKAVFFFMSGGMTHWDSYNIGDSMIMKNWAEKIVNNNHTLGLHPSILSARSKELFHIEIQNFQNITQYSVCCSRQHYLRLIVPQTWQVLEQNDVGWDSSCGFSDFLGFRCGTANPFQVFDIKKRKKLRLRERPLIVMDTAIVEHIKMTPEEAINEIIQLKKQIMRLGGEFVFLLHNSSLKAFEYKNYQKLIPVLYQ